MDTLQMTKDLVAFVSPSHTSNRDVSLFVVDQLKSLDFEIELVTYADENGVEKVNVLGRRLPEPSNQNDGNAGLAYFCHSDVVPVESWTGPGEPFLASELDGRLYGRGSCDMKGSAACMLAAIERLSELAEPSKLTQTAPLYFVCTADEEVSYKGAKRVVAESQFYREMVQRQTRAIIGEPTELNVVYAHKGICKLTIVSEGQAAHSATSEGLNANLAMIPFLQQLKEIYDETESAPQWRNDEFDPPTLSINIGINDHTKAINVKPAQSICTVFYRPLPNVNDESLLSRIETAAKACGLDYQFHGRVGAVYTDPASPFVVEAVRLAGGEGTVASTVSYGTDAGEFTELEHKLVCGPGSIAQAHTTDEWIDLQQLEKGTALYEKFLRYWCFNSTANASQL